jgi:predicted Zn-dependent protease
LIRNENNPLRDVLAAYSYYIEGLGELGQGNRPNTAAAFKKIAAVKHKNKTWQLMIAEKIESLGFSDISKDLLLEIQKEFPDDSGFWVLLAKSAFDAKDPEVLVSALSSAYKLRPKDPMIMNNYAAALLSTRQRPEEALQLTSRMLEQFPNLTGCRLNQCLALAQNKQFTQAETLLGQMETAKLDAPELSAYQLAKLELYLGQQRYPEAQEASKHIDAQYLLPTEKQWLEKARQQIEKKS